MSRAVATGFGIEAALMALCALLPTAALGEEPVRLVGEAFAQEARLEILPVTLDEEDVSRRILAEALSELLVAQDLSAMEPSALTSSGSIAQLNRQGEHGPVRLDPSLFSLLQRASSFCNWSGGAISPLAAQLHELWGIHRPTSARPRGEELEAAVAASRCENMTLTPEDHLVQLSGGSQIDLYGFELGFAVDRAVAILQERGATNGWVELGPITRAFGPGTSGQGWPVLADPFGRSDGEGASRILLRDRSIAMVSGVERTVRVGGDPFASYVDHRSGQPLPPRDAVVVVTELAVDAQALATSLFVMESREGEFRLGPLRPPPAVKWLDGGVDGAPLTHSKGWAALPKW